MFIYKCPVCEVEKPSETVRLIVKCDCGQNMILDTTNLTWEDWDKIFNPKEKAYVCPMCEGRKQVDLDKVGMWSPSDKNRFGDCPLCDGNGFVVKKLKEDQ